MCRKAKSSLSLFVYVGIGILVGVFVLVLKIKLPKESAIREFLLLLDWPVAKPSDWFVHTFLGNSEQFAPLYILLWITYWLMLGGAMGFLVYKVWRYVRRG
jgi:hypothetical protein